MNNNPIVDITDPNLPIWGKQGEWIAYKQNQDLQRELEETKAELAKTKAALEESQAPKNLLGQKGFKACAEVVFIPNPEKSG